MTMLKPVRTVPTEHSEEFLKRASADLGGTMSFILMGHSVEISPFETFAMPIDTYLQSFKRKSVLLNITIEGDSTRRIYAFFEFNSAIILGGIMRQLQESLIKTKVDSQDFSGPVRDAFNEIGNQFAGSLDRILRNNTHANAHLMLDFNKHIYPDEAINPDHFIDNEEYVVWIANIAVQGYPKHKLTVLFPQSFYDKVQGQKVQLQGIQPKKVMVYSWDKDFARRIANNVDSRHFTVQITNGYDDMVHLSKDPHCALICIDFDKLPSPLPHDLKIFAKRMQNAKIPDSIPIWVSITNPGHDTRKELEDAGLRGVNMRDAKKDMQNWILEQIAKIPIVHG